MAWGALLAELAARVSAVAAVGCLLFAAVLAPAPPGARAPDGRPAPRTGGPARRAARAARRWVSAWAVASVLGLLLGVCELLGVPLTGLTPSVVLTIAPQLALGRATAATLVLLLVVAVAARRRPGQASSALALLAAVAALVVPVVLTGHSAAAEDHVLAVTALSVHVVAAALWVGGLLALVSHGRGTTVLATACARFSALALVCCTAVGVTGLLSAWVLVGAGIGTGGAGAVAAIVGTGHGRLLAAKTAALLVLGALGWWHRRRTLPLLRTGRPGAFRRLAVVEVSVMLGTVALAVALSATPPPTTGGAAATGASAGGAPGPGPASAAVPAVPPAPDPLGVQAEPAEPEDMSGHDHGELSVGVLVDETRFHVARPVPAGEAVTVFNGSAEEVTLTASDGSFDLVVGPGTLTTFRAPERAGSYAFSSRHSPTFVDVLVVL